MTYKITKQEIIDFENKVKFADPRNVIANRYRKKYISVNRILLDAATQLLEAAQQRISNEIVKSVSCDGEEIIINTN